MNPSKPLIDLTERPYYKIIKYAVEKASATPINIDNKDKRKDIKEKDASHIAKRVLNAENDKMASPVLQKKLLKLVQVFSDVPEKVQKLNSDKPEDKTKKGVAEIKDAVIKKLEEGWGEINEADKEHAKKRGLLGLTPLEEYENKFCEAYYHALISNVDVVFKEIYDFKTVEKDLQAVRFYQLSSNNAIDIKEKIPLDKAQFDRMLSNKQQMNDFYQSLHLYVENKMSSSIKSFFADFVLFFTLSFKDLKKAAYKERVENLMAAIKKLPVSVISETGSTEDPKVKIVQANLKFMLAMALLAKNPKKGSSDFLDAQVLLKESQDFCEPAKIALNFKFEEFDKFSKDYDHEQAEAHYQEFVKACKDSGMDKVVSKQDIHEVFKFRTSKNVTKETALKVFKTLLILLSLPIAWTAALAAAILAAAFLIVSAFAGRGRLM